jgi:nanoRNase/pAp phosphatase (c-di-AMP/oligoRNAs hydrolase)
MASTKRSALAAGFTVDTTALHQYNTTNFVEYASFEHQQAASNKRQAPSDSSNKQQASSFEQQASSAKPQATSSSIL